jgi:hypothetical protein
VRPVADELYANVGGANGFVFGSAVLLAIVALVLAIVVRQHRQPAIGARGSQTPGNRRARGHRRGSRPAHPISQADRGCGGVW